MPATRKVGPRKRAQSSSEDSEPESLHSDALDDLPPKKRTRSSNPNSKSSSPSKPKPKPKPRKRKAKEEDVKDEEDVDGSDLDLKEGQQIVGRVVQAPKTGWVPPGQVSQNTLDFLLQLKDPACNDREWFKLHEPVYRRVEKEFKGFIEEFTNMLTEVDTQIPPLPPKDVIHRIYRDIRFSNDKTPYKKGLSASFSRSGRKGIFAFYHVYAPLSTKARSTDWPGDESVIAAGAWCPAKNELATLRNHLLHSTPVAKTLHTILSSETFTTHFGPPHPHPHGERQSVFGHEDQLKVAPKGVDKNHKDIALLKCRSLAVSCRFTDDQVIAPGSEFMDTLRGVADVMMPFVHCLNDMMTLPADEDSDEENEEDDTGGPVEDESDGIVE
ncbi:hypothetical protein DEU56DRAFT_935866 [Suillus clintonianus]|uniref:uncharacterized protein n=1 Tax=Suillus clintonianus TaxID=1904413 RepID=UPI001B882D1C|nr:uncharacterized protein DEU56DRAFT_935866 [Suillus clintonianus]KAG2111737.1 hypothetical protein DEU56DRAFT_935866 [Suillus clintonianus]